MRDISRVATFDPAEAQLGVPKDLACPSCGHQDPAVAGRAVTGGRLRAFCDCCGAFFTISLTEAQAEALRRCTPA